MFVVVFWKREDEEKVRKKKKKRKVEVDDGRSKLKKKRKKNAKNPLSPHASHVRGEVEDLVAAGHDLLAVVVDAQVDEVELIAELLLLFFYFLGVGE